MWRSRARLGLGAIVMALAWPGVPASALAGVTQPDAGTLTVSPTMIAASAQALLTLSYTPPNPAPAPVLDVFLSMPTGWTATPPSSSDLACPNSSCSLQSASSTQFEVELGTQVATTLTLSIQATPPSFATSGTFSASEQAVGLPVPAPPPLTVFAAVAVYCPQGGLGTMSVNPSTEPAATSMTFTFTYQAGSCGAGPGGVVTVTVPPGWTLPSGSPGTPGFVTWTGSPPALPQGSTIVVPVGNLAPGTMVMFEYQAAKDPASAGPYTFAAGQAASGEPSQSLLSSPTVMVTPVVVTTTTAPPSSQGTTTTAPPSGSGTATAVSPSGQGTSPEPGTGHPGVDWRPILLVVLGFVLVAGTAGLAAFRSLRRGGHGTAAGDVRAVPRTGPPPSVTVRDTGDRPAVTVRIEPRAGTTMTTIEERVP